MEIPLAIVAGLGMDYILERGDMCFHSTLRGLFKLPKELDLARAYLLSLLLAIPLVQGMTALGWIEPWLPPFAWQANVFGGVIFGIGMVVAATCVSGLFYKLGHGMLGTLAGMAAWAVGDILTYLGPLQPLRERLTAGGESIMVGEMAGGWGWLLVGGFGVAVALFLWRSPRHQRGKLWAWLPLGLTLGLFGSFVWLLARAGGSNYTYGTSSIPSQVYTALTGGDTGGASLWIPVALVSLVPGAFIAARQADTLWVRGETLGRYAQLLAGGLLMGVGAGFAGGCNLGHSLVGVPLLSLGSISTTLSMIVGVFLADRAMKMLQFQL